MSAAAGAPPPPPPPGGNDPSKIPIDNNEFEIWPTSKEQNGHNDWFKNTKIKTCKCKLCGERVKKWSFRCTECAHHICSECADEDNGASQERYKLVAHHSLRDRCGCHWNSGQAPYIHNMLQERGLLGLPPKREAELRRGVEIKREQAIKKKEREAQAQASANLSSKSEGGTEKPQKTPRNAQQIHPAAALSGGLPAGKADGTFRTSFKVEATATIERGKRKHNKMPDYVPPETPPDSDSASELPPSKHHKPSQARPSASYSPSPQPTPTIAGQTPEHPALSGPFAANVPPAQETGESYDHLKNGGTVIIGAGIVGLCIAHELAMKVAQTEIQHRITVVDVRDSYCQLASGACAGILSISGGDTAYHDLCMVSHECFNELISTPGFTEATDMRTEYVYTVAGLDGKGHKRRPDWYVGHDHDSVLKDCLAMGKMNTQKFSSWLYKQCLKHGVQFIFNHKLSAVTSNQDYDLTSVSVQHCHDKESAEQRIRCQNVVFAAGPWSAPLFKRLYKHSPLQLENNITAAHWYRLQVPTDMSEQENVGLVFADMAVADEKLDDKVTIVGQSASRYLSITSVGTAPQNPNLNYLDALEHVENDPRLLRHIKKLTAKRLNLGDNDPFETEIGAKSGLEFVGTSDLQLPVIDKVSASRLGRVCRGHEDKRLCGIWLCFGFGMYGTTLAPGAARVLCRRMFGEKSGINDRALEIPGSAQAAASHTGMDV